MIQKNGRLTGFLDKLKASGDPNVSEQVQNFLKDSEQKEYMGCEDEGESTDNHDDEGEEEDEEEEAEEEEAHPI